MSKNIVGMYYVSKQPLEIYLIGNYGGIGHAKMTSLGSKDDKIRSQENKESNVSEKRAMVQGRRHRAQPMKD